MAKDLTKKQLEKKAAAVYSKAGRARRKAERWEALSPSKRWTPKVKAPGVSMQPVVVEDCQGRGCKVPAGKISVNTYTGYNYTTPSVDYVRGKRGKGFTKPCPAAKTLCRAQLVFVEGSPFLRICRKRGKPGYLVAVKDARHANKVSAAICACTWQSGGNVDACVERVEPGAPLGGLGRARRRR